MEFKLEKSESERQFSHESFPRHSAIVVAPGYESAAHRSGLHRDTRMRLIAAALLYQKGFAGKIIVGVVKIRDMKESFAALMKETLVHRYHVPEEAIDIEEDTFDTASQVGWLKENVKKYGDRAAVITDPDQAQRFLSLFKGFNVNDVDVVLDEQVIMSIAQRNKHFQHLFEKIHPSPEGLKRKVREKLLEQLTEMFDPKGALIQKITKKRVKN